MSSGSHSSKSNEYSNIEMVSYFIFGWCILLFVISIMMQRPIYWLGFIRFGFDYRILLQASRDLLSGINPYQSGQYIKPPLAALINIPLVKLSDINAARVFFVFNNLCILFTLFLVAKIFALRGREKVLLILATLSSSPFVMVTERGNLDGIMFLLVGLALYARKSKYASGIWIGLASILKVYPLIFIVPLLTSKKWKAAFAIIIIVMISILIFPEFYADFVRNQVIYSGNSMRLSENLSSLAPLWYFSMKYGFSGLFSFGFGFLLLLLIGLSCIYYDFALLKCANNEEKTFLFASYAAFCINFPQLVYLYSGLVVFILLASSNSNALRVSRYCRIWLILSLACIFFPAQSINVTAGIDDLNCMIHIIPQLGSAMLLLYAVMVRRNILTNIRRSLEVASVSFPNCPVTE